MKHIIIINGSGGVGKDTFVEMCANHISTINYYSVKEIKELAKQIGWDGGKTEKDRKFLSDFKLLTTEYNNFPFRCICKQIEQFLTSTNELMFIHIRDIPEIKQVKDKYPFVQTLLITSNRIKPITTNIADANVANYNYTYVINNDNDLNDLEAKAIQFVATLD